MIRKVKPFFNIFELKFKVAIFIVMFLYVIGLFYYALRTFRTSDPIPETKVISASMRKAFRDLSTKLRTGLFIKNFPTFDFTTNHFVVDAIVWFEFNKNEIMIKTIDGFTF